MTPRSDVLIIGGGVIGVCSAYYLRKAGLSVTLLEQDEVASGASFGNAGLIVPGHAIPLANPGVVAQGLRWMLRADSPFYVKARLDPALISWLYRFWRFSTHAHARRGLAALSRFGYHSLQLLGEMLAAEKLECGFHQDGWLMAYRTRAALQNADEERALLAEFGVESRLVSAEKLPSYEPHLRPGLAGGVFFSHEGYLDPARFVMGLAERVAQLGVEVHSHLPALQFHTEGRRVAVVGTAEGDFAADHVLIAAGAWSPGLARQLRLRLPIQAAKGYSLTIPRWDGAPTSSVYLSEAKVAATPLEGHLRLAGTLELAGMDLRINPRRVEGILNAARQFIELPASAAEVAPWSGLRPCTPDGLPLIGPVPGWNDLSVATGHGMLGMTLGAATGRLAADLIVGAPPLVDPGPYDPARF